MIILRKPFAPHAHFCHCLVSCLEHLTLDTGFSWSIPLGKIQVGHMLFKEIRLLISLNHWLTFPRPAAQRLSRKKRCFFLSRYAQPEFCPATGCSRAAPFSRVLEQLQPGRRLEAGPLSRPERPLPDLEQPLRMRHNSKVSAIRRTDCGDAKF